MDAKSKKQKNFLSDWLTLFLAPGIGPKGILEIHQNFPNLADFFSHLNEAKLKAETLAWLKQPDHQLIEKHLNWEQASKHHHLISIEDDVYPNSLKQISNPPILLFIKGNVKNLTGPQIAMVGSRSPSQNSIQTTQYFARELSQMGLIITSGLASGIDSAAHRGAIESKSPTVAVMGTGIDTIYPKSNMRLSEEILATGGTLLSEFALSSPPNSYHFPQRNRIISALALACLVMEASTKSGSLITANLANDYGKEVYAVPGYMLDAKFAGNNLLISEGAQIVLSFEQLVNELKLNFPHLKFASQAKKQIKESNLEGSDHPLLKIIDYEPRGIDEIVFKSKMPINLVQSELTLLELSGHILFLPDGQIVKRNHF